MIDEERSIVVWMQPSTKKKIDGDYSERLFIKVFKGQNHMIFAEFLVMPGESEQVDTPDGKMQDDSIAGIKSCLLGLVKIWITTKCYLY